MSLRLSSATRRLTPAFLIIALMSSCAIAAESLTGKLEGTLSPYLAMHTDDPVRWQRWSEETIALAVQLDRPIFISSGYFACHWCHVMQRESFRNKDIAALLNTAFVPVKIDREIDPATDTALIEFTRETTGIAGWPLNVITTPDARPLHGAVYLKPDDFHAWLREVARDWRSQIPESAESRAPDVTHLTTDTDAVRDESNLSQQLIRTALDEADDFQGGFGQQSKFPRAPLLSALLALTGLDGNLDDFVQLTLASMDDKGLQDHVEGGFFRYTTDPDWETPHFEKMLYDNALLASVYLDAAERFDDARWRNVAFDTLDFMLRRLQRDDGGFMSAVSALDATGVEGGHSLWSPFDLGRALDRPLLSIAVHHFGLQRPPAFVQGHLLTPRQDAEQIAATTQMPVEQVSAALDSIYLRLREYRSAQAIVVDDKAVAAWNGLTLSALAKAVAVEARYRPAAEQLAAFLQRQLDRDQSLVRAIDAHGASLGEGTLEDYVLVARGLLDWQRVSEDAAAGAAAHGLIDEAWQRFHDGEGWHRERRPLLRYGRPHALIADHFIPSPTALMLDLLRDAEPATHPRWTDFIARLEHDIRVHAPAHPTEHASGIVRLRRD